MADPPPPPRIPKVVLAVAGFFGFALPLVGVRAVTAEAAMERGAEESKRSLADQRVARLLQPNLSQVTVSAAMRSKEEVDAATGHLTDLGANEKRRKAELDSESKTLAAEIASAQEFLKPFEGKGSGETEVDVGEPDKIGLVRTFNGEAERLKGEWKALQDAILSPISPEKGREATATLNSLKQGETELKRLTITDLKSVKESISVWEKSELQILETLPSAP